MSRINLPPRHDGHLQLSNANRDLQQKLTYQQLLNLRHDLEKENKLVKNISNRLGQELNNLHIKFELKPRQQMNELYDAIGAHPTLHNYQMTLTPLFEAYEQKIQNFEHNFETIYEQFILLEKKFEEVTNQNQSLKMQLTDKIKQNIELYRNGSSQKLNSDFGQLIMQQTNQKQKILIQQNSRLQADFQKYKSEAEKHKRELLETKAYYDESKIKVKQLELKTRTQQGELKISKQNCFDYQLKCNQLESQKNKIQQGLQRAQSQINQLIKEKDFYLKKHEQYRNKLDSNINFNTNSYQNDSSKTIQDLKNKISFLQAQKSPSNDQFKKHTKLLKDFQGLQKQNSRLKQSLDDVQMKRNQLQDQIKEIQNKMSNLDSKITQLEISQSKLKKNVQNLNQKLKIDIQNVKKQQNQKALQLLNQFNQKTQQKQRQIQQLEEKLQRLQLEKDKLQKQNVLNSGKNSTLSNKPSRQSQKQLQKLTQKLSINKDLFQQQLSLISSQNLHLRKQLQVQKSSCTRYKQQIVKLKQVLQTTRTSLNRITQQKTRMTQNIKKVRDQYEGDLNDKERSFQIRIDQIKRVVEESDKKRKLQRERVQEISRKYQNAIDQLKRMYQDNPSMVIAQDKNSSKITY